MNSFNTPVVLIIYKRSETLYLIIEELRKINASSVYVIADGPKNEAENEYVQKARSVIDTIEWDCKIKKIYSDQNLGLSTRIISGLDVVFRLEKQAIILEDDCIPNSSFFSFTNSMLEKYKNNNKISIISGTNMGLKFNFKYDYEFSNYPLIWGWATWKKSWMEYRNTQPLVVDDISLKKIQDLLRNKTAFFHWRKVFLKIQSGTHRSWDHKMAFYLFTTNKLSIIPKLNFVSNQGIDTHSTNTKSFSKFFFLETLETFHLLKHPKEVRGNLELNSYIEKSVFSKGLRSILSYIVQTAIQK